MPNGETEFDLVFEGGGAKGIVFSGALQELDARGIGSRRLVGTSAGAITATLIAAGYTGEQIQTVTAEKTDDGEPVFAGFMDIPEAATFGRQVIEDSLIQHIFERVDIPIVPGFLEATIDRVLLKQFMMVDVFRELFSLVERGGLYAGERFRQWIRSKLDAADQGLADATLGELYRHTHRDLSLVATDTTAGARLVLNHRTSPNCPVDWAVRMSMSIPFVWQEVVWQNAWGRYQDSEIAEHTIVDGGVLSNFPLELVTSSDASVRSVMGNADPDEAGTIGFLIDESLAVDDCNSANKNDHVVEATGLLGRPVQLKMVNRITRLIDTMTSAHDKRVMESHAGLVCRLPAKGYGTTEFSMSDSRRDALVSAGRCAASAYLDGLEGIR